MHIHIYMHTSSKAQESAQNKSESLQRQLEEQRTQYAHEIETVSRYVCVCDVCMYVYMYVCMYVCVYTKAA